MINVPRGTIRGRLPTFFILTIITCSILFVSEKVTGHEKECSIPPIVSEGFNAFKSGDAKAAVKTWIRGPFEHTIDLSVGSIENFRYSELETPVYGKYKSFHVASVIKPTENTLFVYIVINYEHGPVFSKFDLFYGEKGWHVIDIYFNKSVEKVWPLFLLEPGYERCAS